jgi:hypothetical protein
MAEKYGYTCVFENDSLNMYFVRDEYLEGIKPEVTYKQTFYHPRSSKTDWIDY